MERQFGSVEGEFKVHFRNRKTMGTFRTTPTDGLMLSCPDHTLGSAPHEILCRTRIFSARVLRLRRSIRPSSPHQGAVAPTTPSSTRNEGPRTSVCFFGWWVVSVATIHYLPASYADAGTSVPSMRVVCPLFSPIRGRVESHAMRNRIGPTDEPDCFAARGHWITQDPKREGLIVSLVERDILLNSRIRG